MKLYVYKDINDVVSAAYSGDPERDFPKLIGEMPKDKDGNYESMAWVGVNEKEISVDEALKLKVKSEFESRKTKKIEEINKHENAKKELKLLPPNADLSAVIDALNKLSLVLMPHADDSVKPSDAVTARIIIDGKLSGKGK